jgi:plastocyanin
MRPTFPRLGLVLALTGILAACGGGGGGVVGGGPSPILIARAATANGNGQTAEVATQLPNALRVVVTQDGAPLEGKVITWNSTANAAVLTPTQSTTDVDGIASSQWTLGQTAGAQTATATLADASGSPVSFTATATPGATQHFSLNGGNNQTTITNATFPLALTVAATDLFGNGVSGEVVSWVVTPGGSAAPQTPTSTTNANGIASMLVTAGVTAATPTITASLAGQTDVVFHGTIVAPAAIVDVGPGIAFKSENNNSTNPAVDNINVHDIVHWDLKGGGHTVQSTGSPSFASSGPGVLTVAGYTLQFNTAGTYQYDCGIHGTAMTGTIIVH